MPNLTIPGVRERGALVELVLAPSVPWAEARRAAGQEVRLPIVVSALVDTGASHTHIAFDVAEDLGLDPTGEIELRTPTTGDTPVLATTYTVELLFGVPLLSVDSALRVVASDLAPLGHRMLLGRDVLSRLVVVYNGPQDQLTIAF